MERSKRIATSVTPEVKRDFKIAAMRRDVTESELARDIVVEFLDEEEIPDDVKEYFEQILEGGNPKMEMPMTAD